MQPAFLLRIFIAKQIDYSQFYCLLVVYLSTLSVEELHGERQQIKQNMEHQWKDNEREKENEVEGKESAPSVLTFCLPQINQRALGPNGVYRG